MTVTLTQDAQGQLERYLRQVKAALRGHRAVDAAEVERDVLGHIDAELAGQPEPVEVGTLRVVLDRLGTPDSWVPPDDVPAWRRALNRLQSGPEDWRLAYLALGLFAAGVILFLGGPVFWPLEPVLVVASFLCARAAVDILAERDEPIGARRWMVYPSLIVWYLTAAVVLLAWPVGPAMVAATEVPWIEQPLTRRFGVPDWILAPALAAAAVGAWWVLAGLVLLRARDAIRAAFRPFADRFDRRHALRLAMAGLFLLGAAGALMIVMT